MSDAAKQKAAEYGTSISNTLEDMFMLFDSVQEYEIEDFDGYIEELWNELQMYRHYSGYYNKDGDQ